MRSYTALALGLTLVHNAVGRVANSPTDLQQREAAATNAVRKLFNRLFKKAAAATCYQDNYYDFVHDPDFGPEFCQAYINYPNTTVTVTRTPASTLYSTYSTQYFTEESVSTVPAATATVTASAGLSARDAAAEPAVSSNARLAEALDSFRRQTNVNGSDASLSVSFSSACACQGFPGPTVTTTRIGNPKVLTISAYDQETTTILSTVTEGTVTTTVAPSLLPVTPASPSTSTSSVSVAPDPVATAPPFSCPRDNNAIVVQLIGAERYQYLIKCDTDITDANFYGVLSYNSYSECGAACSTANMRTGSPVCQGFSYYDAPSNQGYNCFLKGTANSTVAAIGVDSGILQAVDVGVTDASSGPTTVASGTLTIGARDASSLMSSIFFDSSTYLAMVTPAPLPNGRPVDADGDYSTYYSTYISDGSTFSTGTAFSTYYTIGNVWYTTYYTAYSLSWASATTVYASSATGFYASNSSSSGTQYGPAQPNGDYSTITTTNYTYYYPEGYNVTELIANNTFNSGGTQIDGQTSTLYYAYATGSSGSSGSGITGNSAGVVTATSAWSTLLSTGFVVSDGGSGGGGANGGASGGQGSGVLQTLAPSVISTGGSTASQSGFVGSGVVGGSSGASSTAASGLLPSNATSTGPVTPIFATSGQTGFASGSGFVGSGVISSSNAVLTPVTIISGESGLSGASSSFGSGPLPSSGAPTPATIISRGTGTSGASSTAASGLLPEESSSSFTPVLVTSGASGTAFASSSAASGGFPFSDTNGDRSGAYSSSGTAASGSISTTFTPSPLIFTETIAIGTGSISVPFSAPSGPRSGTISPSFNSSAPAATGSSTLPQAFTITYTESFPVDTTASFPPFTNSLGSRSGGPLSSTIVRSSGASSFFTSGASGSLPSSGFPFPSGSVPFSAPSGPRSGSISLSSGFPFSTGFVPFTNSLGSRSGSLPPSSSFSAPTGSVPFSAPSGPRSGTLPSSGFPAPTGSTPFSAPSGPRSGTLSTGTAPSSSRTFSAPTGSHSGTFPPFPTASGSSCVTQIIGTMHIFTTITEYGCYSNCPAGNYRGYGNSPETFGPPAQATPREYAA